MNWQGKAIKEIDEIIMLLLSDNQYDDIIALLYELLRNGFDEKQKEAIQETIDIFELTEGPIKENEYKEIMQHLEDRLGEPLANHMRKNVVTAQTNSYKTAFGDLKIDFSFNQTSKDALKWMEENQSYWIGNFFKEQLSDKLGTALEEAKNKILTEGLGRAEAGKVLFDTCDSFFNTPEGYKGKIKSYWEGLATHIVTQSREFGHIDAFERAGIEFVKIVAVMDARTSKICNHLNGRVMPVAHLKGIRNKIITANTPEEAKQFSPWLTDKQVAENVENKSTLEILSGKLTRYIGPPPYHFFCRSILVPATKEEFEAQLLAA